MISNNRVTATALAPVLAAALVCFGCGQGATALSSADRKAFAQANADVKQAWEQALAAEQAKDYPKAQLLLDNLAQMQLDDAQKQTLSKEREGFNQRLWQAAEKNDPAAVKAVQAAQKSRSRGQ